MRTFKVEKLTITLMWVLLVGMLFLSWTQLSRGGNNGAVILFGLLDLLVVVGLVSLTRREVTLDGQNLRLRSVIFNKTIPLAEVQEVGVMQLRGRVLLLVSSNEDLAMFSSLLGDFRSLLDTLREYAPEEGKKKLDGITDELLSLKKRHFLFFLTFACLSSIAFGIYNILH